LWIAIAAAITRPKASPSPNDAPTPIPSAAEQRAEPQRVARSDEAVCGEDERAADDRPERGAWGASRHALVEHARGRGEHHARGDAVRGAEPPRDAAAVDGEGQRAETRGDGRGERGEKDDRCCGHAT
jgi:hypothetical protein